MIRLIDSSVMVVTEDTISLQAGNNAMSPRHASSRASSRAAGALLTVLKFCKSAAISAAPHQTQAGDSFDANVLVSFFIERDEAQCAGSRIHPFREESTSLWGRQARRVYL
jgi:hypothetical protein